MLDRKKVKNPDIGNQYWYQEIELYDISDLKIKESLISQY